MKKGPAFFIDLLLALAVAAAVILYSGTLYGEVAGTDNIGSPRQSPLAIEKPETTRLLAVGDIMLSRKVNTLIQENSLNYPVAKMADFLAAADITVANLESPLSVTGTRLPGKGIWFRAPRENVQVLLTAGIDLVTLANNHMVDYDTPALLETREVLDEAGIKHVGAGANDTEARQPLIAEVNGLKIAYLGYSEMGDIFFSYNYVRPLKASDTRAGINNFTVERVLEDVKKVREQADIVIVMLHWGLEYEYYPEDYQRLAAHRLIDGGVDLLIGHHPHCIQRVETYNGGIIAYSLGNFIFDQNFSDQTREGLVFEVELSSLGWVQAKLHPVFILESQPYLCTGEQADSILNRTMEISEGFGANLKRDGDTLLILTQSKD